MILVLPYKDGLFFFLLSIQLCMLTFCQLFTKVEVEVSHSKTVLELEIWPFLFFCTSSLESPTVQRLAVKSAMAPVFYKLSTWLSDPALGILSGKTSGFWELS